MRTRTAAVHPITDTADIVAFMTETAPVHRILNHIGEPVEPPRIAPIRGLPADAVPDWDALAQPSPE